jgi:hypothetical protein
VANVSNGDSDSDQEQETLGSDGTKLTLDLGETELTGEQRDAISSEIVRVMIQHIGKDPGIIEYHRRTIRPIA